MLFHLKIFIAFMKLNAEAFKRINFECWGNSNHLNVRLRFVIHFADHRILESVDILSTHIVTHWKSPAVLGDFIQLLNKLVMD